MPGELVIQHLISLSDDNKAQQQSRVPFAHGTKAERQARREAYTRAPLTHYIPKDHTAKLRENLQCAHRERVAIIVWRVMRPDAWVMIVTTCVWVLCQAKSTRSRYIIRHPFALLALAGLRAAFIAHVSRSSECGMRPSHHAKRYNGWRPSKHTDCQKGSRDALRVCAYTAHGSLADAVCAFT
jgi:hypothetical protein